MRNHPRRDRFSIPCAEHREAIAQLRFGEQISLLFGELLRKLQRTDAPDVPEADLLEQSRPVPQEEEEDEHRP